MDDGFLVKHDSALVRTLSRRELIANLIHLCVLLAVVAPTGLFEPGAYMRSLAVLVCAGYNLQWQSSPDRAPTKLMEITQPIVTTVR